MKPTEFYLSEPEYEQLLRIKKYDGNWRVRERAESILLLSESLSCAKVGAILGIAGKTVQTTKMAWFKEKFASLEDKPRCGAPKKLQKEAVEKLLELADSKPCCATELLDAHIKNGGQPVHLGTIRKLLKDNNRVWKRTRSSLKKKRPSSL